MISPESVISIVVKNGYLSIYVISFAFISWQSSVKKSFPSALLYYQFFVLSMLVHGFFKFSGLCTIMSLLIMMLKLSQILTLKLVLVSFCHVSISFYTFPCLRT